MSRKLRETPIPRVVVTEFDRQRFEALILYIAHRRSGDVRFGRTKMAKALFYSDFSVYQDQGEPLTGATYIRMPFGPFPKELDAAEESLERQGRASLDYDVPGEYEEKRIIPSDDPDTSLFEGWQILTVNACIDRVASETAAGISEISHHHPGWLLAEKVGVEIPYETAILPQGRPDGYEATLAEEVAREHGWQSADGKWIWERSDA